MYKILFLLLISCKLQTTFNLFCEIPNGLSFKDSTQVLLNKEPVGFLAVDETISGRLLSQVIFKKHLNVPNNSTLIFHENRFGNSYFEILMGNSDINFKTKDSIKFFIHKTEQISLDSIDKRKIPNLEKLTSPKIVIYSIPRFL